MELVGSLPDYGKLFYDDDEDEQKKAQASENRSDDLYTGADTDVSDTESRTSRDILFDNTVSLEEKISAAQKE